MSHHQIAHTVPLRHQIARAVPLQQGAASGRAEGRHVWAGAGNLALNSECRTALTARGPPPPLQPPPR